MLTIFVLDYGLVGRIVNLLTWMWIAIRVHFVSCSPKWKEICCLNTKIIIRKLLYDFVLNKIIT